MFGPPHEGPGRGFGDGECGGFLASGRTPRRSLPGPRSQGSAPYRYSAAKESPRLYVPMSELCCGHLSLLTVSESYIPFL